MSYKKSNKLGEGGFGSVYLGELDSKKVAIKIFKTLKHNNNGIKPEILRDICLLKHMSKHPHPNVIGLISVLYTHGIEVIMEYGGSNLKDWIHTHAFGIRVIALNSIKAQITAGIHHLHSWNIFHRDLKPNNILIQPNLTIKICDFSIAKQIHPNNTPDVGTNIYRAPEIFNNTEYGAAVDIWSFGCILYETVTGKPLFTGHTDIAILGSILKVVPVRIEILHDLGLDMINIESCNTSTYHKIPQLYNDNLLDISQRKYLEDFKKQIEQMLLLNPKDRTIICHTATTRSKSSPTDRFVHDKIKYNLCDETIKMASHCYNTICSRLPEYPPATKADYIKHMTIIHIVCLVIASKMHEIKCLLYKDILPTTVDSCINWEFLILKELHFDIYTV